MKMTFRWFGESDPVSLRYISQIPLMDGIVSAVYDVPVGKVWPTDSIHRIKDGAAQNGLKFEVVESVPVHEDIKIGKSSRDEYISVYRENIRRLGQSGVKVICYNFMPVFDWLRSDLGYKNADGSTSLIYREDEVLSMDPSKGDLSLPGWDSSYTKDGLRALLSDYEGVDEEKLWDNIEYFLHGIMDVCKENDVKMAIHPDDPPWGIFGLPRIITGKDSYERLFSIDDSVYNGITLCTGSLGAAASNDLPAMALDYTRRGKVSFVHLRNVKRSGERDFNEVCHPSVCGSLDMYAIVKALHDGGFNGYARPDHGRMIWGETGRPGYGLYDRALGAAYINGLWEAVSR